MREQDKFLRLFLKQQGKIKGFILSVVRDRGTCEDLLQEVALVLWQKFETYDADRSFGAWARGIAANKIMQSFEKSKRRPVVLSPDALNAVLQAYDKMEESLDAEKDALHSCIKTLPDKSRKLLALRYEELLKLRDVAEQLGSTLDAVHKALSRIRIALRSCVERRLAVIRGGA